MSYDLTSCPAAYDNGECQYKDECCFGDCCSVAEECILSSWAFWAIWPLVMFSMCRRMKKWFNRKYSDKDDENIGTMSTRNKIKLYYGLFNLFIIAFVDDLIQYGPILPCLFYGFSVLIVLFMEWYVGNPNGCWAEGGGSWIGGGFVGFFLGVIKAIEKSKTVGQIKYCGVDVLFNISSLSGLTWFSLYIINDVEGIIHLSMTYCCGCEINGCNDCCVDGVSKKKQTENQIQMTSV